MSKSSNAVKSWRKTVKSIIVSCMGEGCQICGYSKCLSALELHHINPDEKEMSISRIMTRCKSWDFIYDEIAKCILLCANCHREVHGELVELPTEYKRFDREEADALRTKTSHYTQHTNAIESRRVKREKTEAYKLKKGEFNDSRKELVIKSGIDFSKRGCITRLSEMLGITHKNARKWLKTHMPEVYALTPSA